MFDSLCSDMDLTVVVSPIATSGKNSNGRQSQYYSYSGSLGNNGIDIKRGAKNSGSNSRQVFNYIASDFNFCLREEFFDDQSYARYTWHGQSLRF